MTIRVLFWSYFRERVGAESAEVSLPAGARVADLLSMVHARWPVLEPLKGCTLVAVGLDQVRQRPCALYPRTRVVSYSNHATD